MATKKKKKKVATKKKSPKKKISKSKAKSKKKKAKVQKKPLSKTERLGIKKDQIIGEVTHYFPHVKAAVIKLKKPLKAGDTVQIKGSTTRFQQRIDSMQMDHVAIREAKKGDEIGVRVKERVRAGDIVILPK